MCQCASVPVCEGASVPVCGCWVLNRATTFFGNRNNVFTGLLSEMTNTVTQFKFTKKIGEFQSENVKSYN